jgi:hypothetical protein
LCLAAGVRALSETTEQDAIELCGPRYGHKDGKAAHRWGKTQGKIGFHGGKVSLARPRVRARDDQEMVVPSWEAAQSENLLGRWAMHLMLINVSTRRVGRAVRLPEGDNPAPADTGVSKSAVSRRFVALSAAQMKRRMASDLSKLGLLVIQIDSIHHPRHPRHARVQEHAARGCGWLRSSQSPRLRAVAWAAPGRDGKAGSPIEQKSRFSSRRLGGSITTGKRFRWRNFSSVG